MSVSAAAAPMRNDLLLPAIFVPLWSSGFVLARLVAPHAEPLTFLAVRFALALLALAAIALWKGAAWPGTAREWGQALLAGVLIHGLYLGWVFWSVANGLPTAISALMAGMQPLLVTLLAGRVLGERMSRRGAIGILVGAFGTLVTLAPKLGATEAGGIPLLPLAICLGGVLSLTLGSIFVKRTAIAADPLTNTAAQYVGALVPTALVLPFVGGPAFDTTALPLWIGLAWSVFGMSLGAVLLLLHMIRKGALSKVSSLFFLVPGVSALMAWIGFGESLTVIQIAGLSIATVGVSLASRG
ncbi:DMT family transporter [Sinorhizobium sp. RAC02]|uniref:DMT family transporter n=1 Tax=Sinorhizobium sp. RAC02 TaxID=1842534 RepID=UPI0008560D07|nr:DMT family transporter [Sinorhizobium sp. RAC02]AOF94094.1 eamA-like transporter family protein [Sinorhizobium sp. RAC02]